MAELPCAVIRPPAKRGDIYRDRILRFSVFVLIDGVFGQDEAVSPREIVDVLRDGARIVGASSMGALRACDCEVAGAQGVGRVFRLFRRWVVNSEDEVAVTFNPAMPYPPLTEAHVNVRIALRRAMRARRLDGTVARKLVAASAKLHFSDRTWSNIASTAAVSLDPELALFLRGCDAKHDDALQAIRLVACRLKKSPAWGHCPRPNPGWLFGLDGPGRERPLDILQGRDEVGLSPGFVVWLLATGRAAQWLDRGASALECLQDLDFALGGGSDRLMFSATSAPLAQEATREVYVKLSSRLRVVDDFQSEWLRYDAARAGAMQMQTKSIRNVLDISLAGMQIAMSHGYDTWAEVAGAAGRAAPALSLARVSLARGLAFREAYASAGVRNDGDSDIGPRSRD